MMLARFALLAVVVVALASLAEAQKDAKKEEEVKAKEEENACRVALGLDNAVLNEYIEFRVLNEYEEACKDRDDKPKCMAERGGWMELIKSGFRYMITSQIAGASVKVKTHVDGALDSCLSTKDVAKLKYQEIGDCVSKGC